jgi:prophage regulatory protein
MARKATLPDRIPHEGYVRLPLILHFLPISRTAWMNGVRSGRYPSPVKLGRCNLWRAQDIHAVIAAIEGKQP